MDGKLFLTRILQSMLYRVGFSCYAIRVVVFINQADVFAKKR